MTDELDLEDELQPQVSEFYKQYWYFNGCFGTALVVGVVEMLTSSVPPRELVLIGAVGLVVMVSLGVYAD